MMRRAGGGEVSSVCILLLSATLSACGYFHHDVRSYVEEPFPKKLSQWHLFTASRHGLKPNQRVVPYDLNTPLFSDYASKYRFVWMPPGASAVYREDGPFEFPVGTILSKSFTFPIDERPGREKLVETRLLVKTKSGWTPLPYVWNEDQSEATLQYVPDPVEVKWTNASGHHYDFSYHIPNTNECRQCHDNSRELKPIGLKARNLNKNYPYADGTMNQIAYWTRVGYLRDTPQLDSVPRVAKWDDAATGSVVDRARAYLDNNCAHCHQPGGSAGYSGVDFRFTQTEMDRMGFCKSPASAGNVGRLLYDVVPGDPAASVVVYRMKSTEPKVMMPQYGRTLVHQEGVSLIEDWIASLPQQSCP
jgi:uncharacterized repeat protein (TIGR03806 family)